MSENRYSMYGKVIRLGSVVALSATFVMGVSPSAFGQSYPQDQDYNRDRRDDASQHRDRDDQFRRRSLGRNRYRYSYNGRDYDYTVDNRRGDLDAREVAERATQSGYQQGLQDGQYDGNGGASKPNPSGHGAYQFALDGWNPEWGSGVVYQRAYRQAYGRGYNEAFSRSHRPGRRY